MSPSKATISDSWVTRKISPVDYGRRKLRTGRLPFSVPVFRSVVLSSQDEAANSAMVEIYKFIESNDDCQFTLDELKNVSKNVALGNRTIRLRLKINYGSRIIIREKPGKLTFICFVDNYQDILS